MHLRMPRLGLRYRFAVAITVSILIPTSLISLLTYRLIDNQAEQSVHARIEQSLAAIDYQLTDSINTAEADALWLSQLFAEEGSSFTSDQSEPRKLMEHFLEAHEQYRYIVVRSDHRPDLVISRPSQPKPDITPPSTTSNNDSIHHPIVHPPALGENGQLEAAIEALLPSRTGYLLIGLTMEPIADRLNEEAASLGIRFMLADSSSTVFADSTLAAGAGQGNPASLQLIKNKTTDWRIAAELPPVRTYPAAISAVRSIAFISVLALLIGLFAAAWLAARFIRPIRTYREAFGRMADGDLTFAMPASTRDEWGRLGASFNRMLKSLQLYAFSDPLTGLPDRRRMMHLIEKHFQQNKSDAAGSQPFAVWFIDVDNFKQLNDTHGHAFGDDVVRQVAYELQKLMPSPNVVSRFGGDEFVMLMPEANDLSLRANAARLQERFERGIHIRGELLRIQLSVGVAVYPKDGDTLDQLIASADIAMYKAKRKGKNNIQFH
ncbi:diguanylate cyclase (GGDEF)-like protein [Paenibacillus cellulosilyticus]|uniref:Diguanylate cyclase (GGDEF)-like protein n=2 Tax=Paenibacillus cellulosilyticus TaxID=375489 RepID=A0A2V2YNG8_9BACL|nr:diguanylate cyclase (GGDEF)-like protein [Paenibacillus cellulosilyticus]